MTPDWSCIQTHLPPPNILHYDGTFWKAMKILPDRSTDDTMWIKCQYIPELSKSLVQLHMETTEQQQLLQEQYLAVQKELDILKKSYRLSCVLM